MPETLCKNCGKATLRNRAGSVTSYFFQHNYCQCQKVRPTKEAKPAASQANCPVCPSCGKAQPINSRQGSFTAFLFKELRCQCKNNATSSAGKSRQSPANRRTHAADRATQRRQFTESLRSNNAIASEMFERSILPPGTVIADTFKIKTQIGLGGMGVVYLAEHLALRRKFALKILSTEFVNEQNWLRFKAEAKILAGLNHSIFVKVYDLGIHDKSLPFYSMDYIEGKSLEEMLLERSSIELPQALEIFLQVLDGLAYAHRNGVIHRDIKPGNIMVSTINGATAVRVLDFGISKLIGSDSRDIQSLTAMGEIFGSPSYMSPEQCSGSAVDARSDIYSIGCTLFEVLTGFVPYQGETALETVIMHQEHDLPTLSEVAPDKRFPVSIELVLAKCLAKKPGDRYQSAKELAIDLNRVKEGKDVQNYSSQIAVIAKAPKTSNKILAVALLSAFLLLVCAFVLLLRSNQVVTTSKTSVVKSNETAEATQGKDADLLNVMAAKQNQEHSAAKNILIESSIFMESSMEQASEDYEYSDRTLDFDNQ